MRRVVVVLGKAMRGSYTVTGREEIAVSAPAHGDDGGYDDEGLSFARDEAARIYAKKHGLALDMVRVIGAFSGPRTRKAPATSEGDEGEKSTGRGSIFVASGIARDTMRA